MKQQLTPEQKERKKELDRIYSANYRKANKETIKIKQDASKKEAVIRAKKHYEANKEKVKQYKKEYNKQYRDKNKDYQKKYRETNKAKINATKRIRSKERIKTDILFKLKKNLRTRVWFLLKGKTLNKTQSTINMLGCTIEEFKTHLEAKFLPWMTWDNYGKYNGSEDYSWDIDHITCLSKASNEAELKELFHYSNTQPLCSKVNREIKNNR